MKKKNIYKKQLTQEDALSPNAEQTRVKKEIHLQILDGLRVFFSGSLQSFTEVILMIVLIEQLNASTTEKTLFAMAAKSGFLISIPISFFLLSRNISIAKSMFYIFIAALFAHVVLLGLPLAPILGLPGSWIIIVATLVIAFPLHGTHTISAHIYNMFHKKSRAQRFASSSIALMLGSIFFATIFNLLIHSDGELNKTGFQQIILISLLAMLGASIFSKKMVIDKPPHQKKDFRWSVIWQTLKSDRIFSHLLTAWMFLGLANLWLLPYRTNLLVEERFGFAYSEQLVMIILVILPETAYILFSFPFAKLVDRINFIVARIIASSLFLLYFMFFFLGTNVVFHILGSIFFGLGRAGGNMAWKMSMNKMASPDKVSLYMSIHSGTTGIRMVLAPIFGLIGLYELGPKWCGIISISFMVISILLFIPLIQFGKTRFSN